MRVKMLKANWPHRPGDTATVNQKTGDRWVAREIAVEVVRNSGRQTKQRNPERHAAKPQQNPVGLEGEQATIVKEEEQPASSIQELSFQELRAVAKKRGIEGYWKMKKVALIEALEAGE